MRTDSMYRGEPMFTKEQATFMAEVIICAGIDWVEACMETLVSEQANVVDLTGSAYTVGMGLAVLYAQLNVDTDGLAVCDALSSISFEETVQQFIKERRENCESPAPDTRRMAETFVNVPGPKWFE